MIREFVKKIYFMLPDSKKYGNNFIKTYNFLTESQYWSKTMLEQYQLSEIKKLLIHSYETVPYYKKLFDDGAVNPYKFNYMDDIKKIPYLTKDIIKNNKEDLISTIYKKNNIRVVTTGGSTGNPLSIPIDYKYDRSREWAFVTNMWSRFGYDIHSDNKMIYLRGHTIKSNFYEYKNNALFLSSYDLNDINIPKYIDLIQKYNPKFIQAYPSSIYSIAKYMNENNLVIQNNNLNAILCSSENLYDFQKESIKKAFNTNIFNLYGHTEHACIGGSCEVNDEFHLHSEYGYTEIINENNKDSAENEIGEIVATGFNNYVMPFIRYKTEDMAISSNDLCKCGRNYKLIKKIEGRKQEYILTHDRTKIPLISIVVAQKFSSLYKIQNIQVEQFKIGEIILRIVPLDKFNKYEIDEIREKVVAACNDNICVKIEFVDNIPRTNRGKYKLLIQHLNI